MSFPWGGKMRPINKTASNGCRFNYNENYYNQQINTGLECSLSSKKRCPLCGKNKKNLGDHVRRMHTEYILQFKKDYPFEYDFKS